ncbi:MAG: NAD(P)-binding domain-containing protein [Candidatus Cloacimonetes bacterium]|nr:NAD(P)-binding domain-containing protein [Candidatus Cloacimonadota bacterium]
MFSETLKVMFGPKKLGPSYPQKPLISDEFETNVKDLYIIGDLSGTPLIKLTLNQGYDLAHILKQKITSSEDPDIYDLIIIGAGCAGLGLLREANNLGLKVLCIDSNQSLNTIRNFTKGKPIFLEPEELTFKAQWGLTEGTRETILKEFDRAIQENNLKINEYEKIEEIVKASNYFTLKSDKSSYKAQTVVLAMGKSGNPRKANVPGESEYAHLIKHRLIDPNDYEDKDIVIYGGGDVALEAAIALSSNNKVTLTTIDKEFVFPKKRNIDQVLQLQKDSRLDIKMNTSLKGVGDKKLAIQTANNEPESIKYDYLFEMIGAELPIGFLRKAGVRLESDWHLNKWIGLVFSFIFVYLIYAWKKGMFPFYYGQFVGHLPGVLSAPSFWYSLVYTVLMVVFGIQAMKRWNRNGKDTYQTYRFISLMFFQVLSFVGIEVILAMISPKYYWRAYGINNPFPLLFDTFYNWTSNDPKIIMYGLISICLFMTFVVIPLFVRRHGKRFCTWICGCGGLAETFGDRWRHLSAKGVRAQKWELVGDLITFWAFTSAFVILLVYQGNTGASGLWHKSYAIIVDFWLVAVIPVALYPFFGGKVWCRFWCPLAKYMQILSKWYSTLQIESNDKCISCTQCSTFCEVGVDVMSFAKNAAPFDNTNSSCIQCGVCISVCPMDVLKFSHKGEDKTKLD